MLSLLSLLLASGTVLKADTERWSPQNYPNPRRNHTGCNTWENSTLCDPDHILTDQWRAQINENIQGQMIKLTDANVPLAEKAPAECQNRSERITIYVLLAKQIWTPNNQSVTGNDLTNFGDELAQRYGLNELPCKTFLLLIGIEAAKLAYVRTGKDLKLPADLMQRVFHEYKLFNAKNFMAGLNKIVDEIGAQMADPFKDKGRTTASSAPPNVTSTDTSTTSLAEIVKELMEKNGDGEGSDGTNGTLGTMPTAGGNGRVDGEVRMAEKSARQRNGIQMGTAQWWMFLALGTAILISFGSLALVAMSQQRQRERRQMRQNILASSNVGLHHKLTKQDRKGALMLEMPAEDKERVLEKRREDKESEEAKTVKDSERKDEAKEVRVEQEEREKEVHKLKKMDEEDKEDERVQETGVEDKENEEEKGVMEKREDKIKMEEMKRVDKEEDKEEQKEVLTQPIRGNDQLKQQQESSGGDGETKEKERKAQEEEEQRRVHATAATEEEEQSFIERTTTQRQQFHWQTVRIGAADLATDVIGGGKAA